MEKAQRKHIGRVEWALPCQHFIKQAAQRVLVAFLIDLAPELFRGHVRGGSADIAQVGAVRREDDRDAEIGQQWSALVIKENIFRLEVPVNNSALMRELQ